MTAFAPILLTFLVSAAMLAALIPLAPLLGLLDRPAERRKAHAGSVPLIGGIAIFTALLVSSLLLLPLNRTTIFGLIGGGLLVIVGVVDDRFGLGPKTRLAAQAGAALLLSLGAGVTLTSVGDILGFGPIGLGPLAVPVTVFAMVGIINAFNMIDGIDGLAGGLALIALGALLLLAPEMGSSQIITLMAIAALTPYLICNLGLLGYTGGKIFLGDAGSMLLGYIVVWAMIDAVESQRSIEPVTALWLRRDSTRGYAQRHGPAHVAGEIPLHSRSFAHAPSPHAHPGQRTQDLGSDVVDGGRARRRRCCGAHPSGRPFGHVLCGVCAFRRLRDLFGSCATTASQGAAAPPPVRWRKSRPEP
jgi:undecaprenyl-phosphate alpha-N-acetylglucosaminyl 1-phosphatetransferase